MVKKSTPLSSVDNTKERTEPVNHGAKMNNGKALWAEFPVSNKIAKVM